MTEIILKESVEHLGEAGDVVDVKPGYARNYLLPQGMAIRATEGNLRQLKEKRRHRERAAAREREVADELARRLQDLSLTFDVQAGEDGQLYGSVTNRDIARMAAEQGVEIEPEDIRLDEPVKELGVYSVTIDLHEDVQPEVKIWVVAEE